MRNKKTAALFLSLALACSVNITAFAADESPKTVDQIGGSAVANVTGTYKEGQSGAARYKVDIAWTDLSFTYTSGSEGTWDPDTHTYNGATEGGWGSQSGTITVTNHSNAGITATPAYEAKTGYESAGMAFTGISLQLGTADNGNGENGAGKETGGTLTVTPTGTLPENTNGDTIGTITVTITASE